MSGLISLPYLVILSTLTVAVITDTRTGKIYNWLTLPMALLGLVYAYFLYGEGGFFEALTSVCIAALTFGALYLFNIIGAGDVKLFMAMGAWLPSALIWKIAVLSVVIGGILAFVVLWKKDLIRGVLKRAQEKRNLNVLPFGISMAVAFMIVVTFSEVLA